MRTSQHASAIVAFTTLLSACGVLAPDEIGTPASDPSAIDAASGSNGSYTATSSGATNSGNSSSTSAPGDPNSSSSGGRSSTGPVGSTSTGGQDSPAGGNGSQASQGTGGQTSVGTSSNGSGGSGTTSSSNGSQPRQGSGGTSNTSSNANTTTQSAGGQASGGQTSNSSSNSGVGGATVATTSYDCDSPISYPLGETADGFSELPDGRCGKNVENVAYTADMNFDKAASLAAFETTLYPVLTAHCGSCHSSGNSSATGAQAPIHADSNVGLAHEYALTRVNLRNPDASRLGTRMTIDRHNCFGSSCKDAGAQIITAIKAWAAAIPNALPAVPWGVPKGTTLAEADVISAIRDDKSKLSSTDASFTKYVSFHEIHNGGATAEELNLARVALSKTLNSLARWAPTIVNPTDIDGRGIIYRFDTRSYWGYNKGITKLPWGGSDDDLLFGSTPTDANGNAVSQNFFSQKMNFASSVSQDDNFAKLVWDRIVKGNVEGAGKPAANVSGFKTDYVEAGQLAYTLSRPDVYNSIMVIPPSSVELEAELGVERSDGLQSYMWLGVEQAITKDSRLLFRAKTKSGGMYYKTFDIFTGQEDAAKQTVKGHVSKWPFWANPIPKAISPQGTLGSSKDFSFFASLAQAYITGGSEPAGCEGQTNYGGTDFVNCRYYTGSEGLQQSAEEVIWNLPNGLQGYELLGGFNQRRMDAFNLIVTDYNIHTNASDKQITTWTETGASVGDGGRLNTGASCFGCHGDGMNRINNTMRDWLDAGTLPTGSPMGADKWINDQSIVDQVKALYPPTADVRPVIESDRRRFAISMATIRKGMMLGPDKNLYGLEPTYWLNNWTKKHYSYSTNTRSNN